MRKFLSDAGARGRTSGFHTALMSFLGFATGAVSGGSLGCAGAAGAGASGGGGASCGSGPVSLIGACRIGPYRLHVQVPVFLIASFGFVSRAAKRGVGCIMQDFAMFH